MLGDKMDRKAKSRSIMPRRRRGLVALFVIVSGCSSVTLVACSSNSPPTVRKTNMRPLWSTFLGKKEERETKTTSLAGENTTTSIDESGGMNQNRTTSEPESLVENKQEQGGSTGTWQPGTNETSTTTSMPQPTVVYYARTPQGNMQPFSPPQQPPPGMSFVRVGGRQANSSKLHNLGYHLGRMAPTVVVSLLTIGLRLALVSWLTKLSLSSNAYSPQPVQHFMLERINDRYLRDSVALQKALESPPPSMEPKKWNRILDRLSRQRKKLERLENKNPTVIPNPPYQRTVIVMDVKTTELMQGSSSTTSSNDPTTVAVDYLRDAISFLLQQRDTFSSMGSTELEVVLLVESPGGAVYEYGLAAYQVQRLRDANDAPKYNTDEPMSTGASLPIKVTVCVDKVAASGGYMIASQANPGQLIAAPFATVGSIGVLREQLNFHDALSKFGVKPLLLKSGFAKAPISTYGKVTDENIKVVQKDLDRVHEAFKNLVETSRKGSTVALANIDREVGTGQIFLAQDAYALGMVDQLMTSDEYIGRRIMAGDRVLKLHKYDRSKFGLSFPSPLELLLRQLDRGEPWKKSLAIFKNVCGSALKLAGPLGIMTVLQHQTVARYDEHSPFNPHRNS